MKPVETMEAPASAGPESAAPELIAHEWDSSGVCQNPEQVAVDFGKDAGERQCVILLGLCEDGSWRAGWYLTTKHGGPEVGQVRDTDSAFPNRLAALRAALVETKRFFEGDRLAVQCINALFAKSLPAGAEASEPAKEEPAPASAARPLPKGVPMDVPMALIQRNPEQPRKDFPAVQEQELADSIQSVGLLQRIIVRKLLPDEMSELPGIGEQDRYEIVAGERRWRAHVRLSLPTIPAEVYTGLTRAEAAAAALVENVQREGLNPIEEAEGYRDLMAKEGLTQEECARRVGVSRPVVANALRVLELPEKVVQLIRDGNLTLAHGTALARFKAFPKHVAIMAEYAVRERVTASQLEKGVPAFRDLARANLAVRVDPWRFSDDVPAELKKGPAIFKEGEWNEHICFDVPLYERLLAAAEGEKKRAEAEAAERARQKAEAAAKNPKKIKSLEDLPSGTYTRVDEESAPLLALVPSDSALELKDFDGEAVTVCMKAAFFRKIEQEVDKLKAADRKEKWPAIVRDTLVEIFRTKKVGDRELMLLVFLAASPGEIHPGPALTEKYAKGLELKLPKKAFSEHVDGQIDPSPKAFALLLAEVGAVGLYRLVLDSWVRQLEDDLLEAGYAWGPDSDLGLICKWVLRRDELGLLEETKAGNKQLVDTIKAQEWYQRELAAAEGREYVPPAVAPAKKTAAAEGKAAKKGGRK